MDFDGKSIALSRDEALVLFEYLSRADPAGGTGLHPAERRVLWNLLAVLEKKLAEPFAANYAELLDDARSRVADKD